MEKGLGEMIRIQGLQGGYQQQVIINNLDLEIEKGEFIALLGPNGSGKSTLFKLISGVLPIQAGQVWIAGKALEAYSALEKAQTMTLLTQEEQISFDFTVEEIVCLGRYAHQKGFFKMMSSRDWSVVEEAMFATAVIQFRKTPFRLLSGGEKQRVLLAKALVQEPEILLLDEPTNHLDIQHTFHLLHLLKNWQQTKHLTVFAILHDLNTASLYADRVALLRKGSLVDIGNVHLLKKEEQLEEVYEVQVKAQAHPSIPKPQLLMSPHYEPLVEKKGLLETIQVTQNEHVIHVHSAEPLRSISNGVYGEGIQWIRHFCNFHVPKKYNGSSPQADVKQWLEDLNIPLEEAAGMMTAVYLEDRTVLKKKTAEYSFLAVVTAGVGNAVDITHDLSADHLGHIGTINTMLFIDGHLTDGALVNALLSATEAKTKALVDMQVKDKETNTLATGTSTDCLLIAATQKGVATPYAGSGTTLGKGIGQTVYEATVLSLQKYQRRLKSKTIKGNRV